MLISSPRSTPDIVLTLALLISAYGFVRLLREPSTDWWSILLAYAGTGLAIESKGLPAVIFAVYAFAVLCYYRHQDALAAWKKHLGGTVLCSVIGLGWFVLMYRWHGVECWRDSLVTRWSSE
jgi:4-amino-4-deoxy-L-arabinose transferase-like glycosyltransferase